MPGTRSDPFSSMDTLVDAPTRSHAKQETIYFLEGDARRQISRNRLMRLRRKKKNTGKAKRPLNGYFTAMLDAKKHKKASFEYKGNTYVRHELKPGFPVYKKA